MKTVMTKGTLVAIALSFLAALSHVLATSVQDYHPTTPGLTSSEASIELTVPQAMQRAADALRAAGLVPHKPMEHTIGGNNEWVMALIDCTPVGGRTRVTTAVAANPNKRGESYRVCMFLIEYMRTGKAPANSGLTGSVIGVWEWKWESYIGSGTSKITLQHDGKATCPDPGWVPAEWWIEPDGTVRLYWPTGAPKTNTHYVMVFTLAQDGRTMSTSAGNYYYKSVRATRIGDAPGQVSAGAQVQGASDPAKTTDLSGEYEEQAEGLGKTKLTATRTGFFLYRIRQTGYGNYDASAELFGKRLVGKWKTTDGNGITGSFDVTFNDDFSEARGTMVVDNGGLKGTRSVSFRRLSATGVGSGGATGPINSTDAAAGVWDWKWQGYSGNGISRVTLSKDGKVTCPDPGWQPGEWWIQDGKVMVYWPSGGVPKTNLHYVVQFTMAPDARSMATTNGNYYYASVSATRVGDAPSSGAGGSTGTGGTGGTGGATGGSSGAGSRSAGGFKLPDPAPGESVISLEPPKFAPGPMPLPPVGAQGGGVKTALLNHSRRTVPSAPSRQSDVTLISLKATHVENQYIPDGLLQVEVELSQGSTEYVVDLYVGGYLVVPKDGVDGVKDAGFQPAYEWVGLSWFNNMHPDQKGKIRRFLFKIPWVLPAQIRAELYRAPLGKPRTFVNQKETTFTMPWGDQACMFGAVFGDKDKGVVTKVAAMVTAGTTEMMITVPGEFRPPNEPYINDLGIPVHFKNGATEYIEEMRRVIGRKVKWRELSVNVGPIFKDRDHRNNRFWPELTNKGYVEAPPIWTQGSGRAG